MTIPNGTRIQHVISRRKGVVHGQCTDDSLVLVRYGKETRPTMVTTVLLTVLK